jgi:hypothetical protein
MTSKKNIPVLQYIFIESREAGFEADALIRTIGVIDHLGLEPNERNKMDVQQRIRELWEENLIRATEVEGLAIRVTGVTAQGIELVEKIEEQDSM